MTVCETLDFSGRCMGVEIGNEILVELCRHEKEAGIEPDPEINAFMKATAMAGQEISLITDYVLKVYLFSILSLYLFSLAYQAQHLISSVIDTWIGYL